MVPGVQLAQVTGNRWAITARGFNGLMSNKLLVLMDGRSVYTPLYSGVYWDMQDTMLEDIDRIQAVAQDIRRANDQGHRVVVVVSAMGKTTDDLADLARRTNPSPPRRELDMLL